MFGSTTYGYYIQSHLASEGTTRNSGTSASVASAYDPAGNFTTLRGATIVAASSDN